MSILDQLHQFDREWQRHLDWRKGNEPERGAPERPPGRYVIPDGQGDRAVLHLTQLPGAVREAFMKDANLAIAAILDRIHGGERDKLVRQARDEATQVLASYELREEK